MSHASAPAAPHFQLSYAALPPALFSPQAAEPVADARAVMLNHRLAAELGLPPGWLDRAETLAMLAGNALPPGPHPIAQAYAGHQYGHFTMLGDGRQVLLGEIRAPDGGLYDLALKGSGRTPYSRSGDGRAALGPMLREYLISEAMAMLGVPTTRSLAVIATGQPIRREEWLPGAILARVAASHIRVGTVQYAATLGEPEPLRALMDHARQRHDPGISATDIAAHYAAILERQARLVAHWMALGFVHGVMNTDNMALSGETIDYGPCAFLDRFDPDTAFSSIDRHGRYAWAEQPRIAQWNLARLAEALLPLFDPVPEAALERANAVLTGFPDHYQAEWLRLMRAKLGLADTLPDDGALVAELLAMMQQAGADFTGTFRALAEGEDTGLAADPRWAGWQARVLARQTANSRAAMLNASPAIIPRNHHVEAALAAATGGDLDPFHRLLAALGRAYAPLPEDSVYRSGQPMPGYRTFCGT